MDTTTLLCGIAIGYFGNIVSNYLDYKYSKWKENRLQRMFHEYVKWEKDQQDD